MPEGDTIFRAARTLHRALAGRLVTRFESVYPALSRADVDTPLAGRSVVSVTSRGKHILMAFSGDLVLHTHMRMHGSWHIYRPGERWRAWPREMRLVVAVGTCEAVGFNVPIAEFLTGRQLERHRQIQALGPDLADPAFDRAEVLRRMRDAGRGPVAELLLNQRVMSGIGNVLKSEILFVAGIDPFRPVPAIHDEALDRLLTVAVRLMAMNVVESKSMTLVIGRRTTGSLNPSATLWVYGRGGKPCRRCGAAISMRRTGADARLTYWCPRCQA
ncbi:MAG: Fpg/Nei family DNA glycosylase [Luteitalea sp.]|nr:Fpg/Nei family DNA glycosylase [Luteitalea sp.]